MRPQCPPPQHQENGASGDGATPEAERQDVGGAWEGAVSAKYSFGPPHGSYGDVVFPSTGSGKWTSYLAVLQISFHLRFVPCYWVLAGCWWRTWDPLIAFPTPWLANGSAETRQPKQNRAFKLLFVLVLLSHEVSHTSLHKIFWGGERCSSREKYSHWTWVPKNVLFFPNRNLPEKNSLWLSYLLQPITPFLPCVKLLRNSHLRFQFRHQNLS